MSGRSLVCYGVGQVWVSARSIAISYFVWFLQKPTICGPQGLLTQISNVMPVGGENGKAPAKLKTPVRCAVCHSVQRPSKQSGRQSLLLTKIPMGRQFGNCRDL